MPTSWRIVKSVHAATAFDGEGARRYGGRWNSPGVAVVYTAQSQALAALELLVHLQSTKLLQFYSTIPARFEDSWVEVIDPNTLPPGWSDPSPLPALLEIGDAWIGEARSVVLQLPSAVLPSESNYLFNPGHPNFGQVSIGLAEEFRFDPRLK